MPRLNNDGRNQAIGMLNAGTSATVVSRHFGCTRTTIKRLRRRFRVTRNIADRPRSGRPCVTNAAYDCYIVLQHLRNRRLTAAATRRQYGIHPQTVRNRLKQNVQPIITYQPYFGQILTRRHRRARQDWCPPMNVGLTLAMPTDAREFYRRWGERFADVCVIEPDRFVGGSVFVWSWIIYSAHCTKCWTHEILTHFIKSSVSFC